MKNMKTLIIVMAIIMLFAAPALAHKMTLEPVGEGVVTAKYDDGSFSSRTEIILYNANDEEIERGKLDENGEYKYDTSLDVAYIVADDGMGHKDEWRVGEEVKRAAGGSKYLKMGGFLVVLAAAGAIFYSRKGKTA